jgi:hypothetical protein
LGEWIVIFPSFQLMSCHRSAIASVGMRSPPYRASAIISFHSVSGACAIARSTTARGMNRCRAGFF